IRFRGFFAGCGGSVPAFSGFSSLPVCMTAWPPERILPENAFCSAFWRASNFEVFTDEMANSTMKRQKRSVIMSANDTSQRSSFSCSSSWCPPFLWHRADIGLGGFLLRLGGGRRLVLRHPHGRRYVGGELLRDDARVVAGLDGQDALERHLAEMHLFL